MPPPAQSGGSPTASDTPSLPPLPGTTRLPNGDLLSIDNIDFASDDDDDGDYHTGEDDDDDEEDEVEYGAGRDGWTLDDMLEEAEAMEELEAAFGLGGGGDDEDDHEMADSAEDDEEEDDGQGVAPLGGFQGSMHDLVQGASRPCLPSRSGLGRLRADRGAVRSRPCASLTPQASRTGRPRRPCSPSSASS